MTKKEQTVGEFAEETLTKELNSKGISKLFAFYGTLRKNQGNYKYFIDKTEHEVLGTVILPGYKMYSFGGYPFVIPSDDKSDTIVVDLMSVPNETAAYGIHAMELGAGYQVQEIVHEGKVYWLYVYRTADYVRHGVPQVESGDWVAYKKEETDKKYTTQGFSW